MFLVKQEQGSIAHGESKAKPRFLHAVQEKVYSPEKSNKPVSS